MSRKRKIDEVDGGGAADSDLLTITPLGAGNEVGRSCHILRFKGKTIMVTLLCSELLRVPLSSCALVVGLWHPSSVQWHGIFAVL